MRLKANFRQVSFGPYSIIIQIIIWISQVFKKILKNAKTYKQTINLWSSPGDKTMRRFFWIRREQLAVIHGIHEMNHSMSQEAPVYASQKSLQVASSLEESLEKIFNSMPT